MSAPRGRAGGGFPSGRWQVGISSLIGPVGKGRGGGTVHSGMVFSLQKAQGDVVFVTELHSEECLCCQGPGGRNS